MATAELPSGTTAPALPPRPQLTPQQKQAVVSATGELICATITARKPQFPDPSLAEAADILLSGAFVSLKRGKHLRACCGGLQGHPVTLGRAVYDAAVRSALDDLRFPPLSPIELPHLGTALSMQASAWEAIAESVIVGQAWPRDRARRESRLCCRASPSNTLGRGSFDHASRRASTLPSGRTMTRACQHLRVISYQEGSRRRPVLLLPLARPRPALAKN